MSVSHEEETFPKEKRVDFPRSLSIVTGRPSTQPFNFRDHRFRVYMHVRVCTRVWTFFFNALTATVNVEWRIFRRREPRTKFLITLLTSI